MIIIKNNKILIDKLLLIIYFIIYPLELDIVTKSRIYIYQYKLLNIILVSIALIL